MRLRRIRVLNERRRVPNDELLTDELLHEIVSSRTPESFLESGMDVELDLAAFLNEKLQEKGLRKSQVIRDSALNETHGYQVFSGERNASRNKILSLAFALKLDLHETQHLLMHADAGALYYKNRRDAIITFCIERGYSLNRCDEELYRLGEETISDDGDA